MWYPIVSEGVCCVLEEQADRSDASLTVVLSGFSDDDNDCEATALMQLLTVLPTTAACTVTIT